MTRAEFRNVLKCLIEDSCDLSAAEMIQELEDAALAAGALEALEKMSERNRLPPPRGRPESLLQAPLSCPYLTARVSLECQILAHNPAPYPRPAGVMLLDLFAGHVVRERRRGVQYEQYCKDCHQIHPRVRE